MDEKPHKDLPQGMFGACQFLWDDEKKDYVHDTFKTEKCCLDKCNKTIDFCFKTCHGTFGPGRPREDFYNHKDCREQCQNQVRECGSTCNLGSPIGVTTATQCIQAQKCGRYTAYDLKCMTKNENELDDCCEKSCTDKKCITDCKQAMKVIAAGGLSHHGPTDLFSDKYKDKEHTTTYDQWMLYITIAIVAILVVVANAAL